MWEALSGIFSWFGGEGIGASIARIAIGLGISKLLNKTNDSAAASSSSSTVQGTRQQISPATDNKIPVAYGDSYFSGTVVDFQMINNSKEMFAVIDLCELTGDLFSTDPGTPSNRTLSAITIDEVYLNNQRVTFKADGKTIDYTTDETGVVDKNAQGLAALCLYSGSSNNPILPTGLTGTLPPVAYEVMPGWDNTYTNQNKVFAVVKCNYDPSKGLHTIPTFKFHVRNTLIQPGDVILDYMTNEIYGCGIPESQIDLASILWLNSYSLQNVTLGSYPAQPRYRINGLVRTTESVMSNLQKLAAACGSYVSYDISKGRWAIVVNKSTAKSRDFNDSNILGQIAINSSNMDSLYNKVEVQFPYKVLKDQYNYVRFDLPSIYRNANEMDNQLQITHEFVNDPVQATILANLDLRQARENQVITFKTDYSQYGLNIGDVFGVTSAEHGWTSKLFRAIRIKRNESDTGQLTVEITGQTYNEDVYTVEDITDFVPLIGVGHSVPSVTPIQTPIAPTVTSQTLSSQPSVTIVGTVPAGLVTLMEFWYHNSNVDSTGVYHSLGTLRPENGGVYTTGDVVSFKTVLLASGNYLFRVSAANPSAQSESQLSPDSTPLAYTYVQAPDVLRYTTPTVDDAGNAADDSGMNIGLMAAYLGYKLFEKPITDYVKDLFGITDDQKAKADASVAKDNAASTNATSAITQANAANTTATSANNAAQSAAATAAAAEAKANAALAAAGNPPIVIKESIIGGHVFPALFGSGVDTSASTRVGIFTHDHLVFGGGTASLELLPKNILPGAVTLTVSVTGSIQNFYSLPGAASFASPPVYNLTTTDKFVADTRLSLYYSTCTYSSGELKDQSWSSWKLVNSNNGVTGSPAHTTPIQVWTNPPPSYEYADYIIEERKDTDGVGEVSFETIVKDYDPFKPNVLKTIGSTDYPDSRSKALSLTVTGTVPYTGGSQLIMFGVSVFNLPDNTAVNNNTLFGHKDAVYVEVFNDAKSFRQIAASSSMFVGIESTKDDVYWSVDGVNWTLIDYDADVSSEDPDWINTTTDLSHPDSQIIPPFKFVGYDGSKFILYGYGDQIATSTDGKVWTEIHTTAGLDTSITHIIVDSSKYLACSINGVQTSTNGTTWSSIAIPSAMSGRGPDCGVWDGSKFVVGNRWSNNSGSVLWSSTDGSSWSAITGLNNPSNSQSITLADNTTFNAAQNYRNASTVAALP